jgi:hypothetical protein
MFILKISHIFPINSGIFFVNDIIDNNGKISQEFILHKLKNKSNWISEFRGFENLTFTSLLYNNLLDNVDKLIN